MRGLVAVLLLVTWPAGARAQSEITLEEAVRLARDESPVARALRGRVAVADAGIDLAGVYPNPLLGYSGYGRFDGSNAAINGTQHQVWIDVPLLVGGQHDARRDVAAAEAVAARAEVDAVLLAIEVEARRAFVALLAAEERLRHLEASLSELARFEEIVAGRAGAGALSRYDTVRVATERARITAERAVVRADARAAGAVLAAIAGRPGWSPSARGTLEDLDSAVPRVDDLPAVRAAQARLEAAERDIQRAEAERIPEIRLAAGAYFTTDGDSSSAFVGLAIPLPVFDTGEAAVHRARAARDAAVEERRALEQIARARIDGAVAILVARRAALEEFDAEFRARLPELREMAESSYRLGASGVFELLDSFRARTEVERARIELLVSVLESQIDVLAVAAGAPR